MNPAPRSQLSFDDHIAYPRHDRFVKTLPRDRAPPFKVVDKESDAWDH